MVRVGGVSQRKEPLGAGPPNAMASVVVKTIWQSKEIHEAGDPPAGVESCSQLVPEAPGGVTSPAKGTAKKKKAVSFHGWVCRTLSGMVLAPSTTSSRTGVPPWVLEEGQGKKRREQRRSRQEGGGEGEIKRVKGGEEEGNGDGGREIEISRERKNQKCWH